MSIATVAHDPSVSDYRDTSPAKLGRGVKGAPLCECPARKTGEEWRCVHSVDERHGIGASGIAALMASQA
jgi:hypothetical protein